MKPPTHPPIMPITGGHDEPTGIRAWEKQLGEESNEETHHRVPDHVQHRHLSKKC